jgi:pyrroline-5-carboxylate reductase
MEFGTIGFIGGGNMARSLIGGLVARGTPAAHIHVCEPNAAARDALAADFGVQVSADAAAAAGADLIVLAVKPQVMRDVCTALGPLIGARRPLVVSIAAGVRIAQLLRWFARDLPVVRAMPNTPALLGAGITGLCSGPGADAADVARATALLATCGEVVTIADESLMDAVTAVSGSGPAYFFLLIEALEAAGIAQGLPADTARRLAAATAAGAAKMAAAGTSTPARLREQVTSPGGTTAAALAVFEAEGLRATVARAVDAATARGRELSARLDD